MNTAARKVLIVEDERPLARALTLKLQHEGFVPVIVGDGEQACTTLSEEGVFDLIILDLVMPKKNGFEVLQFINEHEITAPVIVLSNLSQEEDINKALQLGAKEAYIKANTSLSDIVARVRELIS